MEQRLTLETFEVLYGQLRYDDAKKFIEDKNPNIFYAKIIDGSFYIIKAKDQVEATQKLIISFDDNLKEKYILYNLYDYYIHNNVDPDVSNRKCKLCYKIVHPLDVTRHYKTHKEDDINMYLNQLIWFTQDKKVKIID